MEEKLNLKEKKDSIKDYYEKSKTKLDKKNIHNCIEMGTEELNDILKGVIKIKDKSNPMYKLEVYNTTNKPFEVIVSEILGIKVLDMFYSVGHKNIVMIIFDK